MIGALAFIAMSWIFTIFCAWVSDGAPPNTVKSLAKTKVLRPLTVPHPVTTPSPGTFVLSMPNSVERCSTNMSSSSKLPLSSRSSMRSRAVSLPRACCASIRFSPPPSAAPQRRSSRVSRISFMSAFPARFGCGSNTAFCRREPPLPASRTPARRTVYLDDYGDEGDDRYHCRRDNGRRNRGRANAAPTGRPDAVCRDDVVVRVLGRTVVGLCRLVPGSGYQLPWLPGGPEGRRDRLQRRAQLHRADGADDGRVRIRPTTATYHRDDLARAYRVRPRARLRPAIFGGVWVYPSLPPPPS